MERKKECVLCGKEFEPTCHKERQKFCSAACRIKYHNAKRYYGGQVDVCPECGEPIEQSGERGRWKRFCSDRCRQEYHRKKRQEKQREQKRGMQVCPNCGKEFEVEWGPGKQRRFCSDECRKEWWREYHKAHPEKEPGERNCAYCGQVFTSEQWHGGEYCSRECYLSAMGEKREERKCEWCSETFLAYAKEGQKYCGRECAAAALHAPGHKKGRRRIRYTNREEWAAALKEASKRPHSGKRGKRVFLVCGATNMYTGLDGLLGVIRYRLKRSPYDGNVYVFCDFMGRMLKYIEWDGAGFIQSKRRAQSGSYPWPPEEAGKVLEITEKEFEYLKSRSIVPFKEKK
ncbi:MAG: IS66 family insertion sequence element accessory protein TnpB [Lachnospiraceae bacterium]|nr:IS66 family insertion sequence element accessory protein TnpB [Lachnospiraceae bacterium]